MIIHSLIIMSGFVIAFGIGAAIFYVLGLLEKRRDLKKPEEQKQPKP